MENLLAVLKLNATILPQFLLFFVAFMSLTFLVYRPYMAAFNRRKEATVGGQEHAEQLILETQEIHVKYETKAREVNSQIKDIYEAARKEATKHQDEVVYKAKEEAEALVKATRDEVRKGVASARDELKKTIPELSQAISNRLLGKEVH